MKPIDRKLLEKLIRLAGTRLRGDWILIGGTVLPLLGIGYRVTTDIDLICVGKSDQTDTLQLMKLAESLGLSVESINQAGAFFLNKIPDFRSQMILLHSGPSAQIFRPNATLFLRLKIAR